MRPIVDSAPKIDAAALSDEDSNLVSGLPEPTTDHQASLAMPIVTIEVPAQSPIGSNTCPSSENQSESQLATQSGNESECAGTVEAACPVIPAPSNLMTLPLNPHTPSQLTLINTINVIPMSRAMSRAISNPTSSETSHTSPNPISKETSALSSSNPDPSNSDASTLNSSIDSTHPQSIQAVQLSVLDDRTPSSSIPLASLPKNLTLFQPYTLSSSVKPSIRANPSLKLPWMECGGGLAAFTIISGVIVLDGLKQAPVAPRPTAQLTNPAATRPSPKANIPQVSTSELLTTGRTLPVPANAMNLPTQVAVNSNSSSGNLNLSMAERTAIGTHLQQSQSAQSTTQPQNKTLQNQASQNQATQSQATQNRMTSANQNPMYPAIVTPEKSARPQTNNPQSGASSNSAQPFQSPNSNRNPNSNFFDNPAFIPQSSPQSSPDSTTPIEQQAVEYQAAPLLNRPTSSPSSEAPNPNSSNSNFQSSNLTANGALAESLADRSGTVENSPIVIEQNPQAVKSAEVFQNNTGASFDNSNLEVSKLEVSRL